jgi:hypothetical protein
LERGSNLRAVILAAAAVDEIRTQVGAGHLLLGVLCEKESGAAKLLEANGLAENQWKPAQNRVEAELFREISDSPGAPGES